jgi:hypothetical protein
MKKIPFPREDDDVSTVLAEVNSNDERFVRRSWQVRLKHWIWTRAVALSAKADQWFPGIHSASGLATIDLCICRVLRSSL